MSEFVARLRSNVVTQDDEASRTAGMNIVGTLANHPALAMAYLTFNAQLLTGNSLTTRQRELLILRVAHLRRSDYEWAQHALIAKDVGISAEETARVAEGPHAEGWSHVERVMLTAVDDLILDGAISADTWTELGEYFGHTRQIDLVFTVGTYAMLAMALRSFAVEPEPALVPHLPSQPR
ncbi:carboxymuconolactone decarboxylase family protein [Rhodococcus sp. P1Y]|nr:carboxymuconolactone decarboxylase family protein [Rhodococcus sp. P1Y]